MDTETRNLVAFHGSRVPEMLGNFHLDDHNVEEWSNPTQPGVQHLARKEVGKWVDPDNNADIEYQKREDSKQSDRSKEQSRTEVIQGKAPDSTFQIVRSHRQFQDSDDKSGSRVQSTSTSYQMSSSRGVRSSSKTTSNKTTTKTVTVSGGRSDDFENLKMTFQPLDTSTQRERINVSRSGTMGVRRPPTRRHTPAALMSSSPEDSNTIEFVNDLDDDSDDHIIGGQEHRKICDPSALAIVGFKNISPKIRVGFPVEIQLELQTKLRCSSNGDRDGERSREKGNSVDSTRIIPPSKMNILSVQQSKEEHREVNANESADPLYSSNSQANNENSTFDFRQRRKSYGFESFDSHTKQTQAMNISDEKSSPPRHSDLPSNINSNKLSPAGRPISQFSRLSPSSLSRSWDLIQSVASAQQKREANKRLFPSTSTMNVSNAQPQSHYHLRPTSNYSQNALHNSSTQPKTTIITLNAREDSERHSSQGFTLDSLESSPYPVQSQSPFHLHSPKKVNLTEEESGESPDDCESPYPADPEEDSTPSSPVAERSRKLMQMLDGAPDLLNKMSFKNYFSTSRKSDSSKMTWDDKDETDWEAQRQLSFLNDSLSRILDESRALPDAVNSNNNNNNSIFNKTGKVDVGSFLSRRELGQELSEGNSDNNTLVIEHEIDYNGNVKSTRQSQVSQTWISSGDQKPSQTVRDNDVITSISATQDAYRRGPKKVEFCKTEVHFTPDSGKFHIVETNENKPSTVHLFRRKKRDKKSSDDKSDGSDNYETYLDELELVEFVEEKNASRLKTSLVNSLNKVAESRIGRELTSVGLGVSENPLFQRWNEQDNKTAQEITSDSQPTTQLASSGSLKDILTHHHKEISSETGSRKNLSLIAPLSKNREINDDDYDELSEKNHLIMDVDLDVDLDELDRDEDSQSPSHTILSKYGELKIQRYLKQLKSPSSQAGSESPAESLDEDDDADSTNHFRFDNVLYENGSFVPMATRRSLIEMNNRNSRKRNSASHTSDNSSTTSNYSLPNSDKDTSTTYQPLKLTTMEATVETSGPKPQITSVELRYSLDKERPYNPEPIIHDQRELQHHSSVLRDKREKLSYIPSPVMPSSYKHGQLSFADNPSSSSATEPHRDSSFRNAKPPTPILPLQFATFEKTGAALRERFYSKNPTCACSTNTNESSVVESSVSTTMNQILASSSTTTNNNNNNSSSNNNNNNSNTNNMNSSHKAGTLSKSIVNIGGSEENASTEHTGVYHLSVESNTNNTQENNDDTPTPEPILSMDHTWKGPAHFENQPNNNYKTAAVVRSMTFPKSARPEPEWVSKAKSRETRVTDWSLIGKQYGSSRKSEPPWISEIRFKTKPIPPEEMKSLPKISVVYPWQRDSSAPNSPPQHYSSENGDNEHNEQDCSEPVSKIVSVVPHPPSSAIQRLIDKSAANAASTAAANNNRDREHQYASKQQILHLKSLKSVPEVSLSKSTALSSHHTSHSHNKRLVDINRDADSILTNPAPAQMSLKEDPISGFSRGKSSKKSLDSGIATEHLGSASMSMTSSMAMVSSLAESDESRDNFESLKGSRKPFQSHQPPNHKEKTKGQQSNKNPKAPPKPPKPPQRISSLLQSQQQQLLQQKHHAHLLLGDKKSSHLRRGTHGNSELEESHSSRSNTPTIHQHPTVKVSKLPIRTAPAKLSSPESKSTSSKNKTKQQVSLITEAKRLCKPKSTDSTNASNSNSKHQKCSGTSGGTIKIQKSSLKNSAANNVSQQPSHKKR